MQEQYSPIYHTDPAAIAIPKEGVVRLFRNSVDDKYYVKKSDGTIELFSAGAPEIQDLNDVLVIGNTTGGEDIIISVGDSLLFASGAFTSTVDVAVLTGDQNIVLPDASGTIALTSDIVTEDLQATLAAGNTTGGSDIIISAGDSLVFANGAFTSTIDTAVLTADRNIVFQDRSGVIADDTDLATKMDKNITFNSQAGNYELVASDNNKQIVMTSAIAAVLTVPDNTTAFPIGGQVIVEQNGAGQITFTPEAGVTINSASGKNKTNVQYSAAIEIPHMNPAAYPTGSPYNNATTIGINNLNSLVWSDPGIQFFTGYGNFRRVITNEVYDPLVLNNQVYSDGIHPNCVGSQNIANGVINSLS